MDYGFARTFDVARKTLGFMIAWEPEKIEVAMVFPATRAKMAGLETSDDLPRPTSLFSGLGHGKNLGR